LSERVCLRVKELYWDHYCALRDAYGLKLNYSLKYERGINSVHLIKRKDKKSLKLLETSER